MRTLFEVEGTGTTVPTLTGDEAARAHSLALERYGVQPVQVAENLGRSLADLTVTLGGGNASHVRALVLVGPYPAGLAAAVAARHLVNRGARVTVLFERKPRDLPPLHRQLGSMLAVLGLELQVAAEEDVTLYLQENAAYDYVLDGLGGVGAPPRPEGVTAALLAALRGAHQATISVDCPCGVDPSSGETAPDAVEAVATLAVGFPLAAAALGPKSFGALYLADVSWPPELASEMGFPIAPIFGTGALVRLVPFGTSAAAESGELDI